MRNSLHLRRWDRQVTSRKGAQCCCCGRCNRYSIVQEFNDQLKGEQSHYISIQVVVSPIGDKTIFNHFLSEKVIPVRSIRDIMKLIPRVKLEKYWQSVQSHANNDVTSLQNDVIIILKSCHLELQDYIHTEISGNWLQKHVRKFVL